MRPLPSLMLRVLLIWAGVCAAGFVYGRHVVDLLLPPLTIVSESASSEYGAALHWDGTNRSMLMLRASFLTPSPTLTALGIPVGSVVETGSNLDHILVPPVILLAVMLAWPARSWRQRLALFALAAPAAALTIALTTPFLLAGKIEVMLQERAAAMGIAYPQPFSLHWMIFAEGGGRWLLALLLALLCVILVDWITRPGSSAPPRRSLE